MGAVFELVTSKVTVAGVLFSAPSLTKNVKLLSPTLPGVYVTEAELGGIWVIAPSDPVAGGVTIENVSVLPSESLPVKVINNGVASSVVVDCALATGGALISLTVTEMVSESDSVAGLLPSSVTTTSKLYTPKPCASVGVHENTPAGVIDAPAGTVPAKLKDKL